ncbi:MAG TPA: HAD-IB family hydrolase [Acidimicrobiales bacterium]|nr:HAD-IB family hydrolase [Acidimicrobiales bacterium]
MSEAAERPGPSGLAAFDFDGTLTRGDSLIGFLRRVAGTQAVAAALASAYRLAPAARRDPAFRDTVKALLIQRTLGGQPLDQVQAQAERYGALVAARVTPAMRSLLDRHHQAGHLSIIVSASLELYLNTAAELLGVDGVAATRLEVGDDGRLTGRLDGPNCRGAEKARRLAQWMQECGVDPAFIPVWAYGNSSGDRELLALARVATRVRRGRPPVGTLPVLAPDGGPPPG